MMANTDQPDACGIGPTTVAKATDEPLRSGVSASSEDLASAAGSWRDDPTFDELMEFIRRDRAELDALVADASSGNRK